MVEVEMWLTRPDDWNAFQSAGRIIGWLKFKRGFDNRGNFLVSIRRADYWLVEERLRFVGASA